MAAQIQSINTGFSPNDGTGDSIRAAFIKTNQNFSSISDILNNNVAFSTANISTLISDSATITNLITNNGTITSLNSSTSNITTLIASTGHFTANIQTTGPHTGTLLVDGGIYSSGNLYVGGNLTVAGNLQYLTSANLTIQSPIITVGTGPGGGNPTSDDGTDKGVEILWYSNSSASSKISFLGQQNSTGNLIYFRDASYNGTIFSGNIGNARFGNVYANIASSSQPYITSLGTLTSLNVSGNTTSAGFIGTILTPSQPNITSLGNLTAFTANVPNAALNGNLFLTGGTVYINGSPVATSASSFTGGTVPGNAMFTSGTDSTSKTTGAIVITGGLGVSGNVYASQFFGNITGNVLTSSQPFITNVGTLGNLQVSNNITASTISAASITLSNFINAMTVSGTIQTAAQPNITSVGTLTSLVTANAQISGGAITSTPISGSTGSFTTLSATNYANVGQLVTSNIWSSGGSINNVVIGNVAPASGSFTTLTANSGITGILSTAAQPNITSIGTLTGLNVSGQAFFQSTTTSYTASNASLEIGSITASNSPVIDFHSSGNNINYDARLIGTGGNTVVGSGNISILASNTLYSGNIIPITSNVTTVGTSSNNFNAVYATTFYGTVVTSQLADLAEYYASDLIYDEGTVLIFGGSNEVTSCKSFSDVSVAGVVSKYPAYIMNNAISCDYPTPIALRGRVPVKVYGPVEKGDLLVSSSKFGYAESVGKNTQYSNAVFAKSIETNLDNNEKIIIAVIL